MYEVMKAVERCPLCFSRDLHSAELNGQPAVSCSDCDWIATYAYLKAQAERPVTNEPA